MSYHFASWVRSGLLTGVTPHDTPLDALPVRLTLPVTVTINDVPQPDIRVALSVAGPGDVVGIDPREIIRTEPRHLTPDFPPNLLASIEFDRPEFPWLFTPAAASANAPLRPWIVLAVVRKTEAQLTTDPRRRLPVLSCSVTELPDLRESWLWAHAVYSGSLDGASVDEQIIARPNQSISRLLCPRKLLPSRGGTNAGYYACVVPAFAAGRDVGLDEKAAVLDGDRLSPAWDVTSRATVDLPVYFHWEFAAGPAGDFEDAVDRLQFRDAPPGEAERRMDVGRMEPGVDLGATLVPIGSVLHVRAREPEPSAPTVSPDVLATVRDRIDSALQRPLGTGPVVNPPIYGLSQAAVSSALGAAALQPGARPEWLTDLNLDPSRRVAAALGARVVNDQQEQLVAAAWRQAGEVAHVNQWLRQKQLAREVTTSVVDKRLRTMSPTSVIQVLTPVVAKVTGSANAASASAGNQARSILPRAAEGVRGVAQPPHDTLAAAMVSGAFRRVARPLARAPRPSSSPAANALPDARSSANANTAAVRAMPDRPGMPAAKRGVGSFLTKLVDRGDSEIPVIPERPTPSGPVPPPPAPVPPDPEPSPPPDPGSDEERAVRDLANDLIAGIDPAGTFALEATMRVEASDAPKRRDPLDPISVTPTFDYPMYRLLADLAPDALLPGIDVLPDNSVLLLSPDTAFIEAFMVGLNDEMNRELLWREFPTTLRGTYFRQFWDVASQLTPAMTEDSREQLRDIPPIDKWTAPLGDNMPAARGKQLTFLLFKGDLLVRFPGAIIYAARASWQRRPDGVPKVDDFNEGTPEVDRSAIVMPSMRLTPRPGITMLAFDLGFDAELTTLMGGSAYPDDPGWFFVLEEHPTEPRFGLDTSRGPLSTWRELSWDDVVTREDGSGYIEVSKSSPTLVAPPASAEDEVRARYARESEIGWNSSSAAIAYMFLQPPFRQEVHAAYWSKPVPPVGGGA